MCMGAHAHLPPQDRTATTLGAGREVIATEGVSPADRAAKAAFLPMFGFAKFVGPELSRFCSSNARLTDSMLWSGGALSVSSSFSGIGGPEVALRYVEAAGAQGHIPAVRFSLERCFEHSTNCQKFLGSNFEPRHLHSDLLGLLPPCSRAAVAEIERTTELPYNKWQEVIMKSDLLPKAHCLIHPCSLCPLDSTDIEVACPVCVDYSKRNRSRLGRNGPHSKSLLTWAKMMRAVQPRLIFNENSNQFDEDILPTLLGDVYHIERFEVSPHSVGHTSLNRPRAYTIMIHKLKTEVVGDMRLLWKAPI